MLELLQLAQDTKPKISDNQPTKDELFNHIMSKLKERNTMNSLFIRKYIKQAAKRKIKLANTHSPLNKENKQQILKEGSMVQCVMDSYRTIQKTECDNSINITHDEVVKSILVKQTNHTEQTSEDENKINSFPSIAYSSHMPNANSQTKIRFQTLNPHLQIKKYFKNYHFKQKEQTDNILIENGKQNQQKLSPNKLNTQIFTSKYQLSIKSVVFDNQSVALQKKSSKDSLKSNFFSNQMIEKYKNLKRIQINNEFHDDKIIRKGIFPNINTPSPKSQQFIENYIRINNVKNRVTVKSIAKDKETKLFQANPSRNVLSFRINTIQIKKQF